jgi:hypothetical protein
MVKVRVGRRPPPPLTWHKPWRRSCASRLARVVCSVSLNTAHHQTPWFVGQAAKTKKKPVPVPAPVKVAEEEDAEDDGEEGGSSAHVSSDDEEFVAAAAAAAGARLSKVSVFSSLVSHISAF